MVKQQQYNVCVWWQRAATRYRRLSALALLLVPCIVTIALVDLDSARGQQSNRVEQRLLESKHRSRLWTASREVLLQPADGADLPAHLETPSPPVFLGVQEGKRQKLSRPQSTNTSTLVMGDGSLLRLLPGAGSRRLQCHPATGSDVSVNHLLSNLEFYGRMDATHKRPVSSSGNAALVYRETQLVPELSLSPLVASYAATSGMHNSTIVSEATAWVRAQVAAAPCHASLQTQQPHSRAHKVVCLTTCRDQPKRAVEFVTHHLLLGCDMVILLDAPSHTRSGLPSLHSYLAPFIHAGYVELVTPLEMLLLAAVADHDSSSAHANATPEPPVEEVRIDGGGAACDSHAAEVARKWFLREMPGVLSSRFGPRTVVYLAADVNDMAIVTTSMQVRAMTPEANASYRTPIQHVCLHDLHVLLRKDVAAAAVGDSGCDKLNHSSVLMIPKTSGAVAADTLFDNARTPFEGVGFATGDTGKMLEHCLHFLQKYADPSAPYALGAEVVLSRFSLLGEARSIAHVQRLTTCAEKDAVFRRFHVADGTSWRDVLERRGVSAGADGFTDADRVALAVRVTTMARSTQDIIEAAVDACYSSTTSTQGDGRRTSRIFDASTLTSAVQTNMVDDLPEANSLKRTGFVEHHHRMLHLLQFPLAAAGRRERTVARKGLPIMPQVQRMIEPYVYEAASGLRVRSFEITNERLVAGNIRFHPEAPLAAINATNLHRVLVGLFGDGFSSDAVLDSKPLRDGGMALAQLFQKARDVAPRTVCPSLSPRSKKKKLPESVYGTVRPNVTFCTVVRNRAKLTLEWLLYHKVVVGVGRFIVLDDDSTDDLRQILKPLIDVGFVEVHNASDGSGVYRFKHRVVKGPLLAGYGRCVELEKVRAAAERHSAPSPWIGFIDSDEFLVLPTGECIDELIARVLKSSDGGGHDGSDVIGAVAFSWRDVPPPNNDMFDQSPTQFHRTGWSRGVFDSIQRVKVVARGDLAEAMNTAHKVELSGDAWTVFPNGQRITSEGWFTGANDRTEAQGVLMHFHARSLVSWLQRYLDGFADNNNHIWPFDVNTYFGRWFAGAAKGFPPRDQEWFGAIPGWHDKLNFVVDLLTGKDPHI